MEWELKRSELKLFLKQLNRFDKLLISWRDSETMPSGWTSNDDLLEHTEEHLAETVGFFIGVTKNNFVVTAQSVDRVNNHSNQVIHIPFENIKDIKKVSITTNQGE